MGSIVQDVFGGSNSSQSQSSGSGYNALPPAIQQVISQLATTSGKTLNPNGTPNTSLNTLPSLPSGAQTAQGQIQNQNFAITPQSIQSNISEQMNPYNSSVINQIERAQNGNLSQLNQYLTNSGTFGSNRGMLGASDISQTAADQIGTFLGGQYNTALNNALTTIPQTNASSAANAVTSGQLTQSQAMQNQQAPLTSLSQLAALLSGGIPSTSTSTGTGRSQANAGIL